MDSSALTQFNSRLALFLIEETTMKFCKVHSIQLQTAALLVAVALLPVEAVSQVKADSARRHIIICIDGVGISTINKMRAAGRFRMFHSPSHMISPFPSLTNGAMTNILEPAGAQITPGYEDSYFDMNANKMRGGILDRFCQNRFIRGTFRELFDYHPSAIKSGLGYAAPPISTYLESFTDLVRLKQKAVSTKEPVFLAYTGATDSLAHSGGEKLLRSFLNQLDESVKDIVSDSKIPITVTIFSDHGNHFRKYRRVSLKTPLRRAGFKIEKQIKSERSVVFPQFGLVGSAVLFTREANERRLADVVARVEGVDFAAYESDGIIYIVSSEGEAQIDRRENRYRYQPTKKDPLALLPIVQDLREQKGDDGSDGFIEDSEWFEATRNGFRPDAVRRIYEGMTRGVENRAQVLVNLKDGYYAGSSLLDIFTILQATHGNIGQGHSYGFVMSTTLELPQYIRAEDLWAALGSPQLRQDEQRSTKVTRHD
jgi:hypothetical protein